MKKCLLLLGVCSLLSFISTNAQTLTNKTVDIYPIYSVKQRDTVYKIPVTVVFNSAPVGPQKLTFELQRFTLPIQPEIINPSVTVSCSHAKHRSGSCTIDTFIYLKA